uniref:DUF4218 domain-containing protein n=1 Tax=Lactuca sativa TaxID=4236 RepID=A0A9R1XA71_LACSA|nr:hypothetical protein LSAT_V11C500242220 [Lactuca sativa]
MLSKNRTHIGRSLIYGYCSNVSNLLSLRDGKLIRLKSHDYHMIMQQLLPIAIQSIMHPPTRNDMIRMQEELCVILCLLEKHFLPTFLDVMVHLTMHLTRAVKVCGPFFERFTHLKGV